MSLLHPSRHTDPFSGTRWLPGALVAISLLILGYYLLNALDEARDRTEQQALDALLRQMRTAMQVAKNDALNDLKKETAAQWEGSNPIRWLDAPPSDYVGECVGSARQNLQESRLCFDPQAGELVFRPRSPKRLQRQKGDFKAPCQEQVWRVTRKDNITPDPAYYGFDGFAIVETGECRYVWQ